MSFDDFFGRLIALLGLDALWMRVSPPPVVE
jgi:hypothetical protein